MWHNKEHQYCLRHSLRGRAGWPLQHTTVALVLHCCTVQAVFLGHARLHFRAEKRSPTHEISERWVGCGEGCCFFEHRSSHTAVPHSQTVRLCIITMDALRFFSSVLLSLTHVPAGRVEEKTRCVDHRDHFKRRNMGWSQTMDPIIVIPMLRQLETTSGALSTLLYLLFAVMILIRSTS